jgi:hypothetical protein
LAALVSKTDAHNQELIAANRKRAQRKFDETLRLQYQETGGEGMTKDDVTRAEELQEEWEKQNMAALPDTCRSDSRPEPKSNDAYSGGGDDSRSTACGSRDGMDQEKNHRFKRRQDSGRDECSSDDRQKSEQRRPEYDSDDALSSEDRRQKKKKKRRRQESEDNLADEKEEDRRMEKKAKKKRKEKKEEKKKKKSS